MTIKSCSQPLRFKESISNQNSPAAPDVRDPEKLQVQKKHRTVSSGISVLDRLIKTCPVWLQLCMSQDQAVEILRGEGAGVFLITRDVDQKCMVLWVHVAAHKGQLDVLSYNIKEEKSMMYLERSVLVFEDIFKLVAFYCVSRDILPSPLKLPPEIAGAQTYGDLETISNLGTGFWDPKVKRDLNISQPGESPGCCGSESYSDRSGQSMLSEANGCSCKIELSVGSDRLWFVNPIFIENFSNTEASDKLPLANCVSNPEVKTPKIVYRRPPPPPPPPPTQNPPLPSVPPSAPPPNYKHSHSRPPRTNSPPQSSPLLCSISPPDEARSLHSSSASPPPDAPPLLSSPSPSAPCVLTMIPPSHNPPTLHLPLTPSQPKDFPNSSRACCVDVHFPDQSCDMKINSLEDKKESGENDSCPPGAQSPRPSVIPPAIPRRRQSGRLPDTRTNSVGKKEEPAPKRTPSPPSIMPIPQPRSNAQAETPLNRELTKSEGKEEALSEQQSTSRDKGKKPPPVPPPRKKRLSQRSASSIQDKQSPRKGLNSKTCSTTTEKNSSSANQLESSQQTKTCHQTSLSSSQELKGSVTSLNSPTGGVPVADQDSYSTSSTEDDTERVTSRSIRKTHSFMLNKNRLSIASIANVFTAFMSADRKLQKRITELAQDKETYFGNLVQDYKVYSLEMMAKQSSSTEMLQEIRLMMTQLKTYLVQSTELRSMVDFTLYTYDRIEAIVEAALCKCVLKPLKSPIESYLQDIHTKDGSLRLLTENQLVIQDTTTTDLGVTTSVPESGVMEKISQKFGIMHKTYSPEKKVTYLLKACKLIYDSMATGNPGKPHGADDFLPVLMYVLARCDLVSLLLDVEYMMELMDPALQLGEGSYYLTTTYGALEHIKSYDKITVTRQLSLEVQDSIHRWERRRTLNRAQVSRSSIQDFITISFEELDSKTRTLVIKPDTSIELVLQQCADKFEVPEPQNYGLFVLVNDQSWRLSEEALPHHVKSSLLKCEQKLDFHFLYKATSPEDKVVRELDFL
ncbi:ras and Rab interactor 3 [Rhinophrynus dorsalis]